MTGAWPARQGDSMTPAEQRHGALTKPGPRSLRAMSGGEAEPEGRSRGGESLLREVPPELLLHAHFPDVAVLDVDDGAVPVRKQHFGRHFRVVDAVHVAV